MKTIYTYACKDYPGMESCPGRFYTETEEEIWRHLELHASVAHQENPAEWTTEDRVYLKTLIKSEKLES